MNLLRHKSTVEPGSVRWVTGAEIDDWRSKIVDHLNSNTRADRGRYRYETIQAASNVEPVTQAEYVDRDTVRLEKPAPQKPEEGRKVVEEMVRMTVAQWLTWKRTDPDLFWRKVAAAQASSLGLAHLTLEQAGEHVEQMCRALEEAEAQRTYKQLKIGGGWKGPVVGGE